MILEAGQIILALANMECVCPVHLSVGCGAYN
jgi:hypothetical protein